jgi:diketogulonate reductase-like aldo/keto reductase
MDAGMEHRPFGRTGADVPIIGQGTWELERADRRTAIAALRRGLDLGLRHVDTAEMYGDGAVEELVGAAIASRRDEVYLVSKVLPGHATTEGVVAACARSLRRLQTTHLDCLLLHWPGPHPLEATIAGFERLRAAGMIRAWGVSNFDVDDLEAAAAVAGADRIACNQVLYHLGERAIEHDVLPWCEARGVAVVGYSPFGSGQFPAATGRGGRVLADVAAAHHATPRQVALRFLLHRPSLFAIPKAAQVVHVEDNAGAAALSLSGTEMARIDAAFPRGRRRRGVPTL